MDTKKYQKGLIEVLEGQIYNLETRIAYEIICLDKIENKEEKAQKKVKVDALSVQLEESLNYLKFVKQ